MALSKFAFIVPAIFLTLTFTGCSNTPPPPEKFPELSWGNYAPIKLNVARIDVVKEYVPSDQAPHVETLPPRTLIDSTDRWARDRLQAVGASGFARFIITDASIVEVPLEVHSGLAYLFSNQQSKRYDAHVSVRLEIHNDRGYIDGQVVAEASATRTASQKADERELNETWYLLVQAAMLDLNAELDRNIHQSLARFLQL